MIKKVNMLAYISTDSISSTHNSAEVVLVNLQFYLEELHRRSFFVNIFNFSEIFRRTFCMTFPGNSFILSQERMLRTNFKNSKTTRKICSKLTQTCFDIMLVSMLSTLNMCIYLVLLSII